MSAQLAPSQNGDNVVEMNDSPGRRLRVARQARGLAVEQVAAELHLAPDQISALERDDYDALPGNVFVIGYMRNYARLLLLDPAPLLEAYRTTTPEAVTVPSRARSSLPQQQVASSHLLVKLVSLGIVFAAGWLAFSWWQNQYVGGPLAELAPMETATSPQTASEPTRSPEPLPIRADASEPVESAARASALPPTETVLPQPTPAVPSAENESLAASASAEESSMNAKPEVEDGAEPLLDASAIAMEPEGASADTDTPAPAAPTEGEVVMTFSGPCWVDIRDSERKFKLFGEMSKGDSHVLKGTPPYSVILGNTAAVSITVAGTEFKLQGIARGNVARFTLDPARLP